MTDRGMWRELFLGRMGVLVADYEREHGEELGTGVIFSPLRPGAEAYFWDGVRFVPTPIVQEKDEVSEHAGSV